MAKLVATYAEGFFGVFTEDRTGMRQRALIDIGDKTPTPKEMADLAGVLSDQWGWGNQIEKSPTAKGLPPTAKQLPERKREYRPRDTSDGSIAHRSELILAFVATHPKSDAKSIIAGCGFEPTELRVGRWHHAFIALVAANQIVREFTMLTKERGKGPVRKYVYSLPA